MGSSSPGSKFKIQNSKSRVLNLNYGSSHVTCNVWFMCFGVKFLCLEIKKKLIW